MEAKAKAGHPDLYMSEMEKIVSGMKVIFGKIKGDMPSSLVEVCDENFPRIQPQKIQSMCGLYVEVSEGYPEIPVDRVNDALQYPRRVIELNKEDVLPELKSFMDTYPKDFTTAFMNFAEMACYASTAPASQKLVFQMHGPPGSGKTSLARFFAQVTGLPIHMLKLDEFYPPVFNGNLESLGPLLSAFTTPQTENRHKRAQNMILCFEEADKGANGDNKKRWESTLSDVWDPDTKTLYSSYFRKDVPFCPIILILCNDALKSPSLSQRGEKGEMTRITREQRRKIIVRNLFKKLSEHDIQLKMLPKNIQGIIKDVAAFNSHEALPRVLIQVTKRLAMKIVRAQKSDPDLKAVKFQDLKKLIMGFYALEPMSESARAVYG